MKVIWIRNLSLTLVLLTLCLLFLAKKQPQIAGSLALSIVTLWLHNGKSLPPKPPSFARALFPEFMLLCLFFTSCQTKETAPLSLLELVFLLGLLFDLILFTSREKQTSASGTLILLGGSHD